MLIHKSPSTVPHCAAGAVQAGSPRLFHYIADFLFHFLDGADRGEKKREEKRPFFFLRKENLFCPLVLSLSTVACMRLSLPGRGIKT